MTGHRSAEGLSLVSQNSHVDKERGVAVPAHNLRDCEIGVETREPLEVQWPVSLACEAKSRAAERRCV